MRSPRLMIACAAWLLLAIAPSAEPDLPPALAALRAAEWSWFAALREALDSQDPAAVAWAASKVTSERPAGVFPNARRLVRLGADVPQPPEPPPAHLLDVLVRRLSDPPGDPEQARAVRIAICGALMRLRTTLTPETLAVVEREIGAPVALLLAAGMGEPPLPYLRAALDSPSWSLAHRLAIDRLHDADRKALLADCWRRLRLEVHLGLVFPGPWTEIGVPATTPPRTSLPGRARPRGFPPAIGWTLSDSLRPGSTIIGTSPFLIGVSMDTGHSVPLYAEWTDETSTPDETRWRLVRTAIPRLPDEAGDDLRVIERPLGRADDEAQARPRADALVALLAQRWVEVGRRLSAHLGQELPVHPPIRVRVRRMGGGELLDFTVLP